MGTIIAICPAGWDPGGEPFVEEVKVVLIVPLQLGPTPMLVTKHRVKMDLVPEMIMAIAWIKTPRATTETMARMSCLREMAAARKPERSVPSQALILGFVVSQPFLVWSASASIESYWLIYRLC